ncbi:MAG: hypothetical protein HY322_18555 [Betaproteobacteria bacterium]|nr:hypothetical protein [Betaproteobacteria bacterium]
MDTLTFSKSAVPLIPGFVRSLNATAEAAGFSVDVSVRPFRVRAQGRTEHDDDASPKIVSTWQGPPAAFRRLTFLPVSTRRITSPKFTIGWPNRHGHSVLLADGHFSGRKYTLEVDGGDIPKAIRPQGDVEVIECSDECAYYGSQEALIAAGICTSQQFPVKRIQRGDHWGEKAPQWITIRHPDGSYVHWRETDSAHAQRKALRAQESQAAESATSRGTSRGDGYAGFHSIDEFRPIFTLALGMHTKLMSDGLEKLRAIKSRDGHIYGVSRESQQRIRLAIEELEVEIRDAQLYRQKFDARTEGEKDAARQAVAQAERDPAFRSFMQGLNPK